MIFSSLSTYLPAASVLAGAAVGASWAGREGAVAGTACALVAAAPLCGTHAVRAVVPCGLAAVAAFAVGRVVGADPSAWLFGTATFLCLGVGLTVLAGVVARGAAAGVGWIAGTLVAALPLRGWPVDGAVPWWIGPANPLTRLFYAAGIDWFRRPGLYDTLGTAYFAPGAAAYGEGWTTIFGVIGVTAWGLAGIVHWVRRRRGSSRS